MHKNILFPIKQRQATLFIIDYLLQLHAAKQEKRTHCSIEDILFQAHWRLSHNSIKTDSVRIWR